MFRFVSLCDEMRKQRVTRICLVHLYRVTDKANLLCNYAPIMALMTNYDCHSHVRDLCHAIPCLCFCVEQ